MSDTGSSYTLSRTTTSPRRPSLNPPSSNPPGSLYFPGRYQNHGAYIPGNTPSQGPSPSGQTANATRCQPPPSSPPSPETMAGKKSGKALLREEGLARTDNGLKPTTWAEVFPLNQKNYYTEFMKRDDQILPVRLQNEANRDRMVQSAKNKDRALARTGDTEVPNPTEGDLDNDGAEDDGLDPSKIIVIHVGSQNMRIGLASDALPKTIPMCIAYEYPMTETEIYEALPKRQKLNSSPDQQFGDEFSKKFTKMSNDLKADMRANKRKVLPNSKELVVNYNKRTSPEKISEHNDPMRIEWSDVHKYDNDEEGSHFTGLEAQRIADDSDPKHCLFWPLQHGWYNEDPYSSSESLFSDLEFIITRALRKDLGIRSSSSWEQYSCVFVIPDLYEKKYIEQVLELCLKNIEFKQVTFVQESLAASFGAGYSSCCVVDVGAQKTSISCVDDGMIIEDSRVNLKYGGRDVTDTFLKLMLYDHFPYQDINLVRRYDFLLGEELKISFCTLNQADIMPQLYNFHLRAPNQPTHKYQFKTYDEVILAPMGFFDPSLFDNSDKLRGRRKLVDRSYNAYDRDQPDDPISAAQLAILAKIKPSLAAVNGFTANGNGTADMSTPQKEKPNPFNHLSRMDSQANGDSRTTSAAASPAPEGANTPSNVPSIVLGSHIANGGSPGPSGSIFQFGNGSHHSGTPGPPAGMFVDHLARTQKDLAIERDSVLPIAALDDAIFISIQHAAKGDEKKARDFFGGIMVVGGGSKTSHFGTFLEEKLRAKRPDLGEKILVGTNIRDMDGQVVAWKGATVYGRMQTHESWVGQLEYERLGVRALHHKAIWAY